MKRILFAFVLIALVSGAQAQSSKKEGRGQKSKTERSTEKLNLSDEQKNQIKIVNENYRKQLAELRNQELTVKERNERRHQLQKQHVADIHAVLNKDQRDQLQGMKDRRKQEFEKSRKEKREKKEKDLSLDNTQKQKLQQLREDFKSKAEAIKKDDSLPKEEKMRRYRELMHQRFESMRGVLNKDQMERIQSARKHRPERKTK